MVEFCDIADAARTFARVVLLVLVCICFDSDSAMLSLSQLKLTQSGGCSGPASLPWLWLARVLRSVFWFLYSSRPEDFSFFLAFFSSFWRDITRWGDTKMWTSFVVIVSRDWFLYATFFFFSLNVLEFVLLQFKMYIFKFKPKLERHSYGWRGHTA